jgi:hypothetical protein
MHTIILRSASRGTTTRVAGIKSLPATLSAEVTARVLRDLGGVPDGLQSHGGLVLDVGELYDGTLVIASTNTPTSAHRPGRPSRGPMVRLSLAVPEDVAAWLRARGNVSRAVDALARAEMEQE